MGFLGQIFMIEHINCVMMILSCVALPTFKVYIGRLEKKMLTLKRNKQHEKMHLLMDVLFSHKKKELAVQNPLAGILTKNSNYIYC